MNQSDAPDNLEFRVGLLERAIAESSARIDELTRALAESSDENTSGQDCAARTVEIDADALSPFAAGFHAREIDATGRSYRWTGSSDFFELRFFLNRNLLWTFEMELATNPHLNLGLLRAFVDYAEIPIRIKDAGIHGSVPIRPFSNLVTLTFYLPSRFVPSRLDPSSEDNRSLSVVFYAITLKSKAGSAAPEVLSMDAEISAHPSQHEMPSAR